MRRTETISQHIARRAHQEVDYLFCLNVDMVFQNPWGPETLGDLVAAIHPGYFTVPRQQFPCEHRWVSTAFVADDEGDFYYGGAVFGGQPGTATRPSWQIKPTASWQSGRRAS